MRVTPEKDLECMRQALAMARQATTHGEVPIGAVVVREGQIIAKSHNFREVWQDPTAHAEVIAIREAAAKVGSWRLTGATLYVTLEPCAMCAGAIVLARLDRLVFGARDPKAGACGSIFNLLEEPRLNHRVEVVGGLLERDSQELLQGFFRRLRTDIKDCERGEDPSFTVNRQP